MRNESFAGHRSADAFVAAKLRRFHGMAHSFAALFELMFTEGDNILYERSDGGRVVTTTYREAYESVLRRANALSALLGGLPADAVVAIHMRNSLAWIETFWAVLKSGFRPLLLNLRLDDRSLLTALSECGAAAVITDGAAFPVRTIGEARLLEDAPAAPDSPFGSELLVMSSGTSRHVKVCAYGAEELWHQINGSARIIQKCRRMKQHYKGQLKQLALLPFYHVFGLIAVYIWFAFFSRTFVELPDMTPQTVVETIRRHRVTHIFAVPLFWETIYGQATRTIRERGERTWARFRRAMRVSRALEGVPLAGTLFRHLAFREVRRGLFGESVRFLITGGSGIRPEALRFFNDIGCHLADGYGMTEIGITSVELSASCKTRSAGFIGKPMASVEYCIGEGGELLVRGKALAKYVLEDGRRIPRGNGWFHTRDLAERVGGRYRILGRLDDLIVLPDGENLNPSLTEQRFELPGVRGLCLINARAGGVSAPVLLVSVARHIPKERLCELQAQARGQVSRLRLESRIARVVFVTDPLLTESEFKLDRIRLAADYLAGALHIVTPETADAAGTGSGVETRVRALFAAALGKAPERIGPSSDFFLDEGGTSLDYFAFLANLRHEYGLAFPVEGGRSLGSVREFTDYIERNGEYD